MVKILDTTLREGEQTPGIYFNIHIKMAIAELLDQIGVDIIEAGHPAVTTEIYEAVNEISNRETKALIGAHSRSLEKDVDLAVECGVNFLGIFYCVSEERLVHHSKNLSLAIDQITRVIQYAREKKPEITIRYTPEDTVRSPWKNVLTAASEAVKAGANIISIADTTGYMIPGTERSMYDYVRRLKDELAVMRLYPEIAVHCHNDRGLALANALDGFRAGADIIDVSVMGLGERAGIVDLASVLAILSKDFNEDNRWDLKKIPELYNLISRFSGVPIPANFPFIGEKAFIHCAGVHSQAFIQNPFHYQSVDPEIFGRKASISLDHMSGVSSVKFSLKQIGEADADDELIREVLNNVKTIGQTGKVVDSEELKYIVRYLKEKRLKDQKVKKER